MTRKGILYIAIGESYLNEALVSLKSLREHCPDIEVCIKTHREVKLEDKNCFIEVIEPTDEAKGDKINHLQKTPFDHTLFLDTDTYVCEDFSGVFDLLDRFEMAVAFAPKKGDREIYGITCPDSFIELNTGVLLYRNGEAVTALFEAWKDMHNRLKSQGVTTRDQPAFREALYHSNVSFFVLPHEYNFRVNKINAARADKVYILHGRNIELESLSKRINRSSGQRAYFPYMQKLFSVHLILGTKSDKWMQRLSRIIGKILSLRGKRN